MRTILRFVFVTLGFWFFPMPLNLQAQQLPKLENGITYGEFYKAWEGAEDSKELEDGVYAACLHHTVTVGGKTYFALQPSTAALPGFFFEITYLSRKGTEKGPVNNSTTIQFEIRALSEQQVRSLAEASSLKGGVPSPEELDADYRAPAEMTKEYWGWRIRVVSQNRKFRCSFDLSFDENTRK